VSEYSLTYSGCVTRAPALPPDERRQALIEATLPLLYQHGRNVTTRLIAEAAGVAEGTIFRAFSTKDELIDAAIAHAFKPGAFLDTLDEIEATLPLRDRLVAVTRVMQQRFLASFGLIRALGLSGPPAHVKADIEGRRAWRAQASAAIAEFIEPDAARLRVEPLELVRILWLLTFSGSHADITDGNLMSAEEIVDTLLYGLLADPASITNTEGT
jgi:AcrR family transcriptional regulator